MSSQYKTDGITVQDVLVIGTVVDELKWARNKHKNLNSCHEAYALILEEIEEFWDEVRKRSSKRDKANMAKELVQIAAMCIRAIGDLELTEHLES